MDERLWLHLANRLETLLDLDPAERASQILALRGEDPQLAHLLEVVLAADQASIPLLDQPLHLEFRDPVADPGEHDDLCPGTMVGPWKLVRELGSGGMGRVWLAARDDDQYRVEVALKLIDFARRGDLISAQIRLERQILADLDHPQIARLVDGGMRDNGTPWYAMEYVRGLPLDQYCREVDPSLRERLRLIEMIARVVHHAHTRLVVHRDLKPSNILVDENGIPHLLDFGIAKLLDRGTRRKPGTMTLLAASTPAYAAPEQLRGESVGTKADVYSLGVIAYEIVTGKRPPRADSEAISTDSLRGPLPSATISGDRRLRARVRGDIDSIVSQAMAPVLESRYVSAATLADDINRHLTGMPVLARRAGTLYRARKFLHRHWLGAGASGALVAILVLALAVSNVQMRRAETALARANAVQNFLLEVFDASKPGLADIGIVPQRDLVERAAQRLDQLLDGPVDERIDLMVALSRMYRKLGLAPRAEELLQRAVESIEHSSKDGPDYRLTGVFYELGRANYYTGNFEAGRRHLTRASELASDAGDDYQGPHRTAILFELGATLSAMRETGPAMEMLVRAEELAEDSQPARELLPRIQVLRAVTLGRENRLDEAIVVGEKALRSARRILGARHERTASALSTVGGMHRRSGNLQAAERMLREARRIEIEAYGQAQSATVNNLANVLMDLGRMDEAGHLYRNALELAEARMGTDSAGTASYRRNLALYQATAGDVNNAVVNLREAYRRYDQAYPIDSGNNLNMRSQLSWVLMLSGEHDQSLELIEEIFNRAESLNGAGRSALCRAHMIAAHAEFVGGRIQAALDHIESAIAEIDFFPVENADLVRLYMLAGEIHAAARAFDLSRTYWDTALAVANNRLGRQHPLADAAAARSSLPPEPEWTATRVMASPEIE